jgi:ABC-type glutathione transport system ATPase component
MYAGEIVECAPVDVLFAAPQHPYTIGLLGSIPRLDQRDSELGGASPRITGCGVLVLLERKPASRIAPLAAILMIQTGQILCRELA